MTRRPRMHYVNPPGRKPAGYYLARALLVGAALGTALGSILALLYAIL